MFITILERDFANHWINFGDDDSSNEYWVVNKEDFAVFDDTDLIINLVIPFADIIQCHDSAFTRQDALVKGALLDAYSV